MYLDTDLPMLEKLTIYGELKFPNDPARPVQMLMADSIHIKSTGLLTAGDEENKINATTIDIIVSNEIISEGSLNLFGGDHTSSFSPPQHDHPSAPPAPRPSNDGRNETSFNRTIYDQSGQELNFTLYHRKQNGTGDYDPKLYYPNGTMFNTTFYQKNGTTFKPPAKPEVNETLLFNDYLNQTDAFKDEMKADLKSRKTPFGKLMQPSEAGWMEIWLGAEFVKSLVEGDRLFVSAT